MRLLALVEGPNHVCYRYRIKAFAGALAERGWTLDTQPLAAHPFERSRQLRQAADADVVILQRKLLPLWQLRVLRKAARQLIYDFDDALFHRDSYSRKGPRSWTRLAHFWATIYTADAAIAGNGFLRAEASTYVDPGNVHWIPTCVNPELYPAAQHDRCMSGIRLVWIGQRSTLPCLKLAEPLLQAAAKRLPKLELRVVCNQAPTLAHVRVVPRTWSTATEAHEIAAADIGVSWLPDDPWSRGKCGLKVLQYMAAGLPVVANPVGMNVEMVLHGQTGFLASTPEEWAQAIAMLAADPALRSRMGAAARTMVERHYGVAQWAPRFAALVDRLGRATATAPSGDIAASHSGEAAA